MKQRRVMARERPQYAVWTRAVVAVNAAGEAALTSHVKKHVRAVEAPSVRRG